MGGWGSGRPAKMSDCTEDHRQLDVARLQRDGLLVVGMSYGWNWQRNQETVASIQVRIEAHGVMLNYRHRVGQEGWKDRQYLVALDWTPCHYGGKRAWFRCPANGCGRRVGKLYLGYGGIFACRHCNRLTYSSQRETLGDRATRRANKIRKRLGWQAGMLHGVGGRPKGMHWRTYIRLQGLHNIYVSKSVDAMMARVGRLQSLVERTK